MKIIGLTGGIGSGKSTVADFLVELGASLIDADKVGHEALEPDNEGWGKVTAAFGKDILKSNQQIDRAQLAKLVFGKPDALKKLDAILHPIILGMVKTRLAALKKQGVKVAVVEVPLLIEADWKPYVDEIWVTVASEATVLKRLKDRNGYSEAESLSRIRSQMTNEERIKFADRVIHTDGPLNDVKEQVRKQWAELKHNNL
jgi:dephospho-CoA kinase